MLTCFFTGLRGYTSKPVQVKAVTPHPATLRQDSPDSHLHVSHESSGRIAPPMRVALQPDVAPPLLGSRVGSVAPAVLANAPPPLGATAGDVARKACAWPPEAAGAALALPLVSYNAVGVRRVSWHQSRNPARQ